ncbi:MAG: type II toxin-antitoxin system VapC family toxin [Opitutaceae bacterium]
MIIPDLNLLIYAHHAADPRHAAARVWWEACLNGDEPIGLAWVTLLGFMRLTTHRHVLATPLPVATVADLVEEWLDQPVVRVLVPGREHARHCFGFLRKLGVAGNLTTDAHLAALALEYQAELHSTDTDFARFPGLRWRNPLDSKRRK